VSDLKTVRFEDASDKLGFTAIPNVLVLDFALTPLAFKVYVLLRFFARQAQSCWPGQDRLAGHLDISDRTLRTYLNELSKHELIRIVRRGLGQTNEYVILSLADRDLPPGAARFFRSDRQAASGLDRTAASDKVEAVEADADEVKGTLPLPAADFDVVRDVFDHWKARMGRNIATRLTAERSRAIKARLADGYSPGQIKRAIDGCAGSDFHMGRHEKTRGRPQNDLTLICRNGSKLETFEAMPPPGGGERSAYDRIAN
jgi:hypothetical protein